MEARPHALLLKFPGTNCDVESARALEATGFSAEVVPITRATEEKFARAQLVMLCGGFSYGDYVMAGRLAQLETERRLGDELAAFRDHGGYILGVCNGFQILTKMGLLPEGSLIHNSSGRFLCQWVGLKKEVEDSPYLADLPGTFELPVAHAEGRFVAREGMAEQYFRDGLVALTYVSDINGSTLQIAGLQDQTRRVFGLMPHPERFLYKAHHYDPDWDGGLDFRANPTTTNSTTTNSTTDSGWGWGYYFFKSLQKQIVLDMTMIAAV